MVAGFYVRAGATLTLFGFAFFFVLAALGFSDILWRAINVPAMHPFYADLRSIPSVDQLMHDNNLRIENPADPWGRPFNYPKIWANLLQPFRICADPYFCFGTLQFLVYLVLVIGLIWKVATPLSALAIAFLAISPPVALLLERGNVDGFVFLLVLLSVYWRGPFRTPLFIALAGGLKVFPVVALPFVFRPKTPFPYLLALAIASPLLIATFTDLRAILAATQVSDRMSYGIPSFAALLGRYAPQLSLEGLSVPALMRVSASVFLFLVLLAYLLFRSAYHRLTFVVSMSPQAVDVLLVFGVIFLSTMMVASNWAYRIVFLCPVAFLASRWLFDHRPTAISDWLLLVGLNAALFGSFWSLIAPHGQILFNPVTLVAAALLFPLVTLVSLYKVFPSAMD